MHGNRGRNAFKIKLGKNMTPSEYLQLSERTESMHSSFHSLDPRTIHGVIGLAGESGELLDNIKKTIFYGMPPDKKNLKEEVGDSLWYIAQICRAEGWTIEELMSENIDKLFLRYPESFTTKQAEDRADKQ